MATNCHASRRAYLLPSISSCCDSFSWMNLRSSRAISLQRLYSVFGFSGIGAAIDSITGGWIGSGCVGGAGCFGMLGIVLFGSSLGCAMALSRNLAWPGVLLLA